MTGELLNTIQKWILGKRFLTNPLNNPVVVAGNLLLMISFG